MVTVSNDNHRCATTAASQNDNVARKNIAIHCRVVMRNARVRQANRSLRSIGTHATNGAGIKEFGTE